MLGGEENGEEEKDSEELISDSDSGHPRSPSIAIRRALPLPPYVRACSVVCAQHRFSLLQSCRRTPKDSTHQHQRVCRVSMSLECTHTRTAAAEEKEKDKDKEKEEPAENADSTFASAVESALGIHPYPLPPQMTPRISSNPHLKCRSVPPPSSMSSPFVMTGSPGHISRPTSRPELAALQRKDI